MRRAAIAGLAAAMILAALAVGYGLRPSPARGATVHHLACKWNGTHMVASGDLQNTGRGDHFDLQVRWSVAGRPSFLMDAAVYVDGHMSQRFSWGDDPRGNLGQPITSCAAQITPDSLKD